MQTFRVEMNYLKVYCNLIRKAEQRGYTKKKAKEFDLYVEGHHTFPVSIFGKNKRIVYLTAREHYIAHALLERICIQRYGINNKKSHKMIWAHVMMKGKNKLSKVDYYNSHLYEVSRLRISQISISEETRQKMSNHRKKSKWWNNGIETKFCEKCPGPEWKRGRPKINVGRKFSTETIEKMRIKAIQRELNKPPRLSKNAQYKNKIWWNNGFNQIKSKKPPAINWEKGKLPEVWWNDGKQNIKSKECPGEGWILGMLKKKTTKNLCWWNNGFKNTIKKECPGDGWVKGMLKN